MADACFFQTESSYISCSRGLSYPDEIWFADRLWHSQQSDVTQSETRNSNAPPMRPIFKTAAATAQYYFRFRIW